MAVDAGGGLNLDSRSLDALRSQAARDPKAAARQAAVQFESLFMQMVLKSMRDATPKADGSAGGGDAFAGMLDTQLAKQFAGRPQGLADMLEKQLTRHMQNLPAVTSANQPQATAAAAQPPGTATSFPAGAMPAAAAGPVSSLSGAAPGSREAEFIRRMLPHAQEAERQSGVPASFILGQAALESGWGQSEAKNPDGSNSFNLFGIKATAGWKGASTQVMTTEYQDLRAVRQRAGFRSYSSYAEAFADYARLVGSHPRYSGVARGAPTPEAFAGGMQRAGYATDPSYAAKLARTINHTLALQRALG
jgi:peptidoglycan hydrolase FlgJ